MYGKRCKKVDKFYDFQNTVQVVSLTWNTPTKGQAAKFRAGKRKLKLYHNLTIPSGVNECSFIQINSFDFLLVHNIANNDYNLIVKKKSERQSRC